MENHRTLFNRLTQWVVSENIAKAFYNKTAIHPLQYTKGSLIYPKSFTNFVTENQGNLIITLRTYGSDLNKLYDLFENDK